MFGNNTIRKRVMAAVNKRIDEAENTYVKQCEAIEREADTKKTEAADRLVATILKD